MRRHGRLKVQLIMKEEEKYTDADWKAKIEFLGSLPIFTDLDEEQLEALAEIAPEYAFHEKSVIAYQRDVANKLYIVREGRLYAREMDEQGRVRSARAYTAGDYFEDTWLFTPSPHPRTVRATDPGRLIIIDSEHFIAFLDRYPEVIDRLEPLYNENDEWIGGLSEEAWEELTHSRVAETGRPFKAAGMAPEELVLYQTRRSRYILVLRVASLTVLLFLWLAVYWALAGSFPFLRTGTGLLLLLGLPVLILLLLIGYQYEDWRNDYLLITNKQVLHYELNLSPRHFGTVVQKIPVDQIQSTTITRPNLISNLLNLGTARIMSASASAGGSIIFNYIQNPDEVTKTINNLRARSRELRTGQEQALLRNTLEQHFNIAPPYKPVGEPAEPPRPRQGPVRRFFSWFSTRAEVGGVVTYRKSVIFLLLQMRWSLVFLVLLIAAAVGLIYYRAPVVLWLVWFVLGIINGGYMLWQILDWHDDVYQVSDKYVVDIDRQPFGLSESRTQAELANIQNVNVHQPGLLSNLFNFGNVVIETAGASSDLVFERVAQPNMVQQDIFQRRERLRQQQQVAASEQRRKEYAMLIDVFQQIQEQGQVPRRTPYLDFDEVENDTTGDHPT